MVFRKDELEIQLKDEHKMIQDGKIRDDSPLDVSDDFGSFCNACRIGDLKACQEWIAAGVNINARDRFDYTPLILVSCKIICISLPIHSIAGSLNAPASMDISLHHLVYTHVSEWDKAGKTA
jgi:hypothetical protein